MSSPKSKVSTTSGEAWSPVVSDTEGAARIVEVSDSATHLQTVQSRRLASSLLENIRKKLMQDNYDYVNNDIDNYNTTEINTTKVTTTPMSIVKDMEVSGDIMHRVHSTFPPLTLLTTFKASGIQMQVDSFSIGINENSDQIFESFSLREMRTSATSPPSKTNKRKKDIQANINVSKKDLLFYIDDERLRRKNTETVFRRYNKTLVSHQRRRAHNDNHRFNNNGRRSNKLRHTPDTDYYLDSQPHSDDIEQKQVKHQYDATNNGRSENLVHSHSKLHGQSKQDSISHSSYYSDESDEKQYAQGNEQVKPETQKQVSKTGSTNPRHLHQHNVKHVQQSKQNPFEEYTSDEHNSHLRSNKERQTGTKPTNYQRYHQNTNVHNANDSQSSKKQEMESKIHNSPQYHTNRPQHNRKHRTEQHRHHNYEDRETEKRQSRQDKYGHRKENVQLSPKHTPRTDAPEDSNNSKVNDKRTRQSNHKQTGLPPGYSIQYQYSVQEGEDNGYDIHSDHKSGETNDNTEITKYNSPVIKQVNRVQFRRQNAEIASQHDIPSQVETTRSRNIGQKQKTEKTDYVDSMDAENIDGLNGRRTMSNSSSNNSWNDKQQQSTSCPTGECRAAQNLVEENLPSAKYKIIEVPMAGESRRSNIAHGQIIQERNKDGVILYSVDKGPFPQFRLPRDRRQYMDEPVDKRDPLHHLSKKLARRKRTGRRRNRTTRV